MDQPLVYQLYCQVHSWVAMLGLDKRWKHLSVKPTPRWDFPLLVRALEDYQLIGRACKCRNAFSLPVLMPEDLTTSYVQFLITSQSSRHSSVRGFLQPSVSSLVFYLVFYVVLRAQKLSSIPVVITARPHLFPFRTQKLSSRVPTILGWRRPGKIGCCRILFLNSSAGRAFGC